MKRNAIAAICAAVVAAAIVVPVALQGAPAAGTQVQDEAPVASATASSAEAEGSDAAADADASDEGDDADSVAADDGDGAADGAAGGATDDAAAPSTRSASGSDDGPTYEQDAILVNVRDGATAADLNAQLAGLDYIATKQVADDDIASGYVKLELASGTDVKDAEARIVDDAAEVVAGSQPNYYYHLLDDIPEAAAVESASATASGLIAAIIAQATAIDDPRASEQWALDAVNARDAWDTAQVNRAVTVAVIDNGCLTTHEDLASNIRATYNAVEGGTDVTPSFGAHGTHVCGIIAAEANNAKGVAGVSYNAGLLPIQVFENTEGRVTASSESLIKAFTYIRRMANTYNIKVVNMSVGGTYADGELDEGDEGLISAVESAYSAGILTVCSAGNDAATVPKGGTEPLGAYLNFPSDWIDCVLGVIASTKEGVRADYSNYNTSAQITKDITAPGSSILSTYSTSTSRYGTMSGTSMASPCVAGIAALVYSVNSGFSAADVSNIICATAQDLGEEGWDNEYGFGLVDAGAAVAYAKQVTDGGGDTGGTGDTGGSGDGGAGGNGGDGDGGTGDGSGDSGGDGDGGTGDGSGSSGDNGNDDGSTGDGSGDGGGSGDSGGDGGTGGDGDGGSTGDGGDGGTGGTGGTDDNPLPEIKLKTIVSGATATITLSQTAYTYDGVAKKPGVTVKVGDTTLVQDVDYTLVYSDNTDAGTATVKAVAKGDYTGHVSGEFIIVPAPVASMALASRNFTYSGSAQTPAVTVRGVKGGNVNQVLVQGVDCTVVYSNNTNAGTATATVVGTGNYSGSKSETFTIAPAPIASLTLSATSFKYNGSAKAPAVTVRGVKGGKAGQVLAKGSDYSLRLSSGRKAVGTYSVVVTGVGNYSGTKTASFTIVPAGTTIGKLTAVSKGFTARWGKRTAQTSGYQLQYGLKSSFKSAKTVTVKSVKTVSKKVTKLKAKRKYYVRVRTYKVVGGKTYYSAWSGKKAVTTKR